MIVAVLGVFVLAIDQRLAGIVLLVVGVLLWLAGHWHYSLRHHEYMSPLAQRLLQQIFPRRLDPTRGWGRGWPVTVANPPSVSRHLDRNSPFWQRGFAPSMSGGLAVGA